jgi:hypothetical protein
VCGLAFGAACSARIARSGSPQPANNARLAQMRPRGGSGVGFVVPVQVRIWCLCFGTEAKTLGPCLRRDDGGSASRKVRCAAWWCCVAVPQKSSSCLRRQASSVFAFFGKEPKTLGPCLRRDDGGGVHGEGTVRCAVVLCGGSAKILRHACAGRHPVSLLFSVKSRRRWVPAFAGTTAGECMEKVRCAAQSRCVAVPQRSSSCLRRQASSVFASFGTEAKTLGPCLRRDDGG